MSKRIIVSLGLLPLLGVLNSSFCVSLQSTFLSSQPPPATGAEGQPQPLQLLSWEPPARMADLASITETAVHDPDTSLAALLLPAPWLKENDSEKRAIHLVKKGLYL